MAKDAFKIDKSLSFRPTTEPTDPTEGQIYLDSTLNVLRKYEGGAWKNLASAEGGGSKTYIDVDDAKLEGSTFTWATFDDASAYVDGTGGTSANLTLAQTEVANEVLEGDKSLKISKGAADAQYEGLSVLTTTIDNQDFGRSLQGSIEVNANHANYASGDLRLFAYDVTNSEILSLIAENDGDIPKAKGRVHFKILTNSTTASVRLSLMVNTTNASAWDVFIDDIKLGPGEFAPGAIITEWESFTPTGSWANTTYEGQWRRVGDSADVRVTLTLTGAPSGNLEVDFLPSFLSWDTNKYDRGGSGEVDYIGSAFVQDSGTAQYIAEAVVFFGQTTRVRLHTREVSRVNSTNPFTFASGDIITIEFTDVPVVGWKASNLISTTEALFMSAKVIASRSTSAQSFANGSTDPVVFDTVTLDNLGIYNNSTGVTTIPRSGVYQISATVQLAANAGWEETEDAQMTLNVNSGTTYRMDIRVGHSGTVTALTSGSLSLYLNKGDTFTIDFQQNSDNTIATVATANRTQLSVVEQPDFTTFGTFGEVELLSAASDNFRLDTAGFVTSEWPAMTGNSINLTPGSYFITGLVAIVDLGTNGSVQQIVPKWCEANGNNTTTSPTVFGTTSGVTIAPGVQSIGSVESGGAWNTVGSIPVIPIVVTTTVEITLFLVPRVSFATAADLAVKTNITAMKVR
jgi:stress response protein SCP2